MNKKAFIFDLDGVIVDTAKFHFLAWKKLADSLNINFTHEINEQLKGVSRVRSLEIILSQGNIQASQEDKNNWLLQKNEDYLKFVHQMDESEILPRVEEVLQFLLSKDINGQSEFVKLLNDPNALFQLAWFATKGQEAFSTIHDYYKKEIDTARKAKGPGLTSQRTVVKKESKPKDDPYGLNEIFK